MVHIPFSRIVPRHLEPIWGSSVLALATFLDVILDGLLRQRTPEWAVQNLTGAYEELTRDALLPHIGCSQSRIVAKLGVKLVSIHGGLLITLESL